MEVNQIKLITLLFSTIGNLMCFFKHSPFAGRAPEIRDTEKQSGNSPNRRTIYFKVLSHLLQVGVTRQS